MNFEFATAELAVLAPEILILTMACVILVMDVYLPERLKHLTYQMIQATLVATALLVIATYPSQKVLAMHHFFIHDAMGAILKLFILGIVLVVFIYSRNYLKDRNLLKGEYFILGLFAVLGMMVMVSAHHLLMIYLGLELLSLSLYAMVAMYRDLQQASEAAMKYFVLGALASGMLLYGISMLYGITGSLDLAEITQVISQKNEHHTILVFALVFIVVGLAFKLGAVPFHMWVPDVYQGAPTAVTLFIGSAPKLAAFAMMMRLLVEGMQELHADWQGMLILLAILSMGTGNLIAIAQTNLKRMLAYSTISHVGFLLLGILTGTAAGYAASMFYVIVYALMSLGGFGIILLLSRKGFEADRLEDLKGLNERHSWYAFIMLILMLSMAGVPPFLGFWAKWSVLSQVVQADMVWLAVIAVAFAIIGAFYYLRIIKLMYFDKAEDNTPIEADLPMRIALSINGLVILMLGLLPHSLMQLCLNTMNF